MIRGCTGEDAVRRRTGNAENTTGGIRKRHILGKELMMTRGWPT